MGAYPVSRIAKCYYIKVQTQRYGCVPTGQAVAQEHISNLKHLSPAAFDSSVLSALTTQFPIELDYMVPKV